MTNIDPGYEQRIRELIKSNNLIAAIKLYREMTGAGLAESKQVVETMARGGSIEPSSEIQQSAEPVLDAKIRSLLSQRKKIEAVKIYREEYGVGLKEAKDYVDQIEFSLRREIPSGNIPSESAIGSDPFAESNQNDRRRLIALAVGMLILLLGIGIFFLLMSP